MIIGLTIHDNDYNNLVTKFAEKIGAGYFILEDPDGTPEWYTWERQTTRTCNEIIKLTRPSSEDTAKLRDVILRSWKAYVAPYNNDYLTDRLEITFPATINTRWQNGEQFYVFPTSGTGRVLSF